MQDQTNGETPRFAASEPVDGNENSASPVNKISSIRDENRNSFVPTDEELKQLVRHYCRVQLKESYNMFQYAHDWATGSSERHMWYRTSYRLQCLEDVLGEDMITKLRKQVYLEFGEKQNPRHWNVFLHGDDRQRDEVAREVNKQLLAKENKRLQARKAAQTVNDAPRYNCLRRTITIGRERS